MIGYAQVDRILELLEAGLGGEEIARDRQLRRVDRPQLDRWIALMGGMREDVSVRVSLSPTRDTAS